MYRFKHTKAAYQFSAESTLPSGERSRYAKIERINIVPNLIEGWDVIFEGPTGEALNDAPLKDFDLLASQVAQALYPMTINVSKDGAMKRIKDFDGIVQRLSTRRAELLDTHSNAYWVERYIDQCLNNATDEECFRKAIMRNSFMQLFFMQESAPTQHFISYDFPMAGIVLDWDFDLPRHEGSGTKYRTECTGDGNPILAGKGELVCRYLEKGLLEEAVLTLETEVRNEGYYDKSVKITLI